jgi:hypothetical protein
MRKPALEIHEEVEEGEMRGFLKKDNNMLDREKISMIH